jgi:dTDP-4-dehydrorhamnose 3,5-epimerase
MFFRSQAPNGPVLIEGSRFADGRGAFMEIWQKEPFEQAGIGLDWQQENLSISTQSGTIRGLHWQLPPFAQAKLVRVVKGRILDVVVDIQKSSANFAKAYSFELTGQANVSLYVPVGFAHGFCTLEADTIVTYKTSARYDHPSERAVLWSCPKLNIDWPIQAGEEVISDKDRVAPNLAQLSESDLF